MLQVVKVSDEHLVHISTNCQFVCIKGFLGRTLQHKLPGWMNFVPEAI